MSNSTRKPSVLYGIRALDFTPDGSREPVKGKQYWISFDFKRGSGIGQEIRKIFVSDESVARGDVEIQPNLQLGIVNCVFDHDGKLLSIANIGNAATPPPAAAPPKS
jgi:hypothetical protein